MEPIEMSKKDKVIFCTKADHEAPSKYELPPPLASETRRGVVLPDGQINWTCPCLGGLPYGPCGFEFREFFSCLHKIQDDDDADSTKTQECFPKFASMKECFSQFPKLYPPESDDELTESTTNLQEASSSEPTVSHANNPSDVKSSDSK